MSSILGHNDTNVISNVSNIIQGDDITNVDDGDFSGTVTITDLVVTGSSSLPGGSGGPEFTDDVFAIKDSVDPTKKAKFECSGISTSTTRTYTLQDSDDVIVCRDTTDTLTNKTLNTPIVNTITATNDLTLRCGTGSVKVDGNTSTGDAILEIDRTDVTDTNNVTFQTANVDKWTLGNAPSTEDFRLYNYNTAANVLIVDNATDVFDFSANPTVSSSNLALESYVDANVNQDVKTTGAPTFDSITLTGTETLDIGGHVIDGSSGGVVNITPYDNGLVRMSGNLISGNALIDFQRTSEAAGDQIQVRFSSADTGNHWNFRMVTNNDFKLYNYNTATNAMSISEANNDIIFTGGLNSDSLTETTSNNGLDFTTASTTGTFRFGFPTSTVQLSKVNSTDVLLNNSIDDFRYATSVTHKFEVASSEKLLIGASDITSNVAMKCDDYTTRTGSIEVSADTGNDINFNIGVATPATIDSTGLTTTTLTGQTAVTTNTINEYTGGSGVTIDNIELKDDTITPNGTSLTLQPNGGFISVGANSGDGNSTLYVTRTASTDIGGFYYKTGVTTYWNHGISTSGTNDWTLYDHQGAGTTIRGRSTDGAIFMPNVYSDDIGAGNRDLEIKSDGQFGYNASVLASKTNIQNIDSDFVHNLVPKQFNYRKSTGDHTYSQTEYYNEQSYGLIAEEVELVNAELCSYDYVHPDTCTCGDNCGHPDNCDCECTIEQCTKILRTVHYKKLIPALLDQIKKQKILIDDLASRLLAVETAIAIQ